MKRERPGKSGSETSERVANEVGGARRRADKAALGRRELSKAAPFDEAAKRMGLGPRNEKAQASLRRSRLEP